MRAITKTYLLYTLQELSPQAQEKAYHDWLLSEEHSFSIQEDYNRTLKAFQDELGVKVKVLSSDIYSSAYGCCTVHIPFEEELRGLRLYRYLLNNYWDLLYAPKKFYTPSYKKKRTSRIIFQPDCLLTGWYTDDIILEPIYRFLERPEDIFFEELLLRCLDNFFKDLKEEIEYTQSEEYFSDLSDDNGWEYLFDGTIFKQ